MPMITVSTLNEVLPIRHAFFTREGGVSEGIYASLNVGSGSKDDPAAVAANRARAMAMIEQPASALVTLYQAHTNRCVVIDKPFDGAPPEADAMVTKTRGLVLGILTADCAPVLFADGKAGVIGAAHAGWKGALGGVLESTVAAMEKLGAKKSRIVSAIGPCIAQRSYEVGPDFPAPFLAESDENHEYFAASRKAGHFMFDLPGYVARRLSRIGVIDVTRTPCDTCSEEGRFFSYRRSVLRGEPDYGRGLSAIVLE